MKNKKSKFKKLKEKLSKKKATAELDASKDPMSYYKNNIELSLKGKKGVAV